mmetsp:Transcript_3256/g.11653  ORF Transcript_3256/g.11653 Transcript_3256/m.11653 type:complete len:215 (+) Transcript_3256:2419-3063(+)
MISDKSSISSALMALRMTNAVTFATASSSFFFTFRIIKSVASSSSYEATRDTMFKSDTSFSFDFPVISSFNTPENLALRINRFASDIFFCERLCFLRTARDDPSLLLPGSVTMKKSAGAMMKPGMATASNNSRHPKPVFAINASPTDSIAVPAFGDNTTESPVTYKIVCEPRFLISLKNSIGIVIGKSGLNTESVAICGAATIAPLANDIARPK